MRIAFYGTKPYDRIWFDTLKDEYHCELQYTEDALTLHTVKFAQGCDGVCVFVNDRVDKEIIDALCAAGVTAILLRSAGYNHIDMEAAKDRIRVYRVPSYSPEAVAEFAVTLLLTLNRRVHKAYVRTREYNMTLNGLLGTDLHEKTAGIIGTGKIGQAMIRILQGFGMKILAFDPYPVNLPGVEYVPLEKLVSTSDVISLHCPLTKETNHIIDANAISLMKTNVFLINTSRGALIDTDALIQGLLAKKFRGVGLDVYEEEDGVFYEDHSDEIMSDEKLSRLLTFPNVLITSHMGFFTEEALKAIAMTTLENASACDHDTPTKNLL